MDAVYVIWLDEARARMALELAHAGYAATIGAAGAKPHEIPDFTDPADTFTGTGEEEGDAGRAADPAERAAQVRAFLAAAGGEVVTP